MNSHITVERQVGWCNYFFCEHQAKSGAAEALQSADLLQKAGAGEGDNMSCVHPDKVWKKQKQCKDREKVMLCEQLREVGGWDNVL